MLWHVPDTENKAHFHQVTIGSQVKNQTQILDGLKQGMRVFISPPKDYKLLVKLLVL